MKIKATILSLTLAAALLAGCGAKEAAKAPAANTNTTTTNTTEAVAAASITDKEAVFEKTMGKGGTWIIAATKDLTFDHEIVLEGDFKNTKGVVERKIAIYNQDDKFNVTARYNLTAPKLTVKSPGARIQGGVFKGDVYVDAANFELVDAKIQGNLYFTKQEYMDQFKKTNGKDGFVAEVTGTTGLVK